LIEVRPLGPKKISIEFALPPGNFWAMRWLFTLLVLGLMTGPVAAGTEGEIYKVLPQFLDKKGRNSVSPSLYDRDAYQAHLRKHPTEISALRFAIQWKAKAPESETLKMRVELRGEALHLAEGELPRQSTLEHDVHQHRRSNNWTSIRLSAEQYKTFGEITAWRVSLWDGDRLLSEQQSFLW
jgi:hypothetical protein